MEPETWVAIGALVTSLIALVFTARRAQRERDKNIVQDSAQYLEAQESMRMTSIEAAERVVDLYSSALKSLQKEVDQLKLEVRRLTEVEKALLTRIDELERGM